MENQNPNSLIEYIKVLELEEIPKSELWKYVGSFLERKSRRLRLPLHGNFELTPLCNFNCKMCYIHLNKTQFDSNTLLSISQWKYLADLACRSGMRFVSLTGGECLTYPGFDELYTYLASSGLGVYVMTNGYLIDDKYVELFKQYMPVRLQISLYGSSEETYESVTGIRAFSKVYENIIKIRDANIPLSIAITPSVYMRGDIENIILLARKLNVRYGVNPALMQPREITGRTKDDLTLDEYLEIYHFLSRIHHEKLISVDYSKMPEENHGSIQNYGIRCGAGRSSFGIQYDGSMCPCLSLHRITVNPFVIGFEEAWKQINKAADEYPLPLECGNCVYQKTCLSCVAIHDSAPVPGHCDPKVCERMKRLVQEGFIPLKTIC